MPSCLLERHDGWVQPGQFALHVLIVERDNGMLSFPKGPE